MNEGWTSKEFYKTMGLSGGLACIYNSSSWQDSCDSGLHREFLSGTNSPNLQNWCNVVVSHVIGLISYGYFINYLLFSFSYGHLGNRIFSFHQIFKRPENVRWTLVIALCLNVQMSKYYNCFVYSVVLSFLSSCFFPTLGRHCLRSLHFIPMTKNCSALWLRKLNS